MPDTEHYATFLEIPQYREGTERYHVPIRSLQDNLDLLQGGGTIDLDPDFQRPHVWTEAQQEAFIEHVLRGGRNTVIRWNSTHWNTATDKSEVTLVDGKQRITAARLFLNGQIKAFGRYIHDYQDRLPFTAQLQFSVNELQTRREILKWYLEINEGNVAHTPQALQHVRRLLQQEASPKED